MTVKQNIFQCLALGKINAFFLKPFFYWTKEAYRILKLAKHKELYKIFAQIIQSETANLKNLNQEQLDQRKQSSFQYLTSYFVKKCYGPMSSLTDNALGLGASPLLSSGRLVTFLKYHDTVFTPFLIIPGVNVVYSMLECSSPMYWRTIHLL